MEMLKQKFHNVSQGIMYGFAIGLGFAVAENIVYLVNVYAISEFSAQFWLAFQGRFWTTTLLHGITTAFFGLFYAGAYLSKTLQKGKNESPLLVLLAPFQLKQLWTAFSLHNARKHLIFKMNNSLLGHSARTVILEGFWLAIIIHIIFNMALDKNQSWIAIFIVLFGTWQLKKCSNLIKSL
jgi:RsiW-degrading membrane proteinase PrsW (M82 family)